MLPVDGIAVFLNLVISAPREDSLSVASSTFPPFFGNCIKVTPDEVLVDFSGISEVYTKPDGTLKI